MIEAQILPCDILLLLSFQVIANTRNNKSYSSMIASLQNSFALIQTSVTSKLQGLFSNDFIDHLIKTFSSIPIQNCSGNLNFKEVSFGHFGFAYCKQAIWAHGNCAIVIWMTGVHNEVFIIFDICIAIVTVAKFYLNMVLILYRPTIMCSVIMKDWLAISLSGATHGWNAHLIHGIGIRNGLVLKLGRWMWCAVQSNPDNVLAG